MKTETLQIIGMTREYARLISQWKYDGVYSFYNHNEDNIDGYMDGAHFACVDALNTLAGYFCFGDDARIPTVEENMYTDGYLDVGLGLRPDLCGKGLGTAFVSCGLDYAQAAYNTRRFRLSVAAFNERAVKTYQKAGFLTEREVTNEYFKNRFYIMTCIR